MENTELPRIEVQAAKTDPRVEELEDQIADLIAQMLYAHILRKGLLKKRKNVLTQRAAHPMMACMQTRVY